MAKKIQVALTLDSKQFDKNIAQSEAKVDKFSKNSSSGIGKIGTALAAIGAGAAIKGIINTGAAFQDLQNSLNVVFGSVDEGARQFERVQDFAEGTQFSVQTLTGAFVQLKGAGVEPTDRLLQIFADTASVTTDQMGTFQAALDLVSRSTAGGLGLEDLNRLADRGIPVFQILEQKLGITRLQVSEFGKTAEGANKIITALTDELENRFGGALANSANNVSRLTNNLGDALDKLQKSIFDLISDELAAGLKGLTTIINDLAEAIERLEENGTTLVSILEKVGLVALFIINPFGKLKLAIQGIRAAGVGAVKGLRNMIMHMGLSQTASKRLAGVFERLVSVLGGAGLVALFRLFGKEVEETEEKIEELDKTINELDMTPIEEQLFLQREAARMAREEVARLNAEYNSLTDNDTLLDMDVQEPIDKLQAFGDEIDRSLGGIDEYNRLMTLFQGMFADPKTIADMEKRQNALDDLNSSYSNLFDPLDKLNEAISDGVETQTEYNILQKELNRLIELGIFNTKDLEEAQRNLDEAFGENEGLQSFISTLNSATDTLSNSLADAFMDGESAMDSFKNFFRTLVQQIIADAIKLLFIIPILEAVGFSTTGGSITGLSGGGLLGKLGFGQTGIGGGNLMPNRPVLVGESGPELFYPASSGSLTPNSAMGGTVTYNINAVDAPSFQALVASDPEFIYNVTRVGAKRLPGAR